MSNELRYDIHNEKHDHFFNQRKLKKHFKQKDV